MVKYLPGSSSAFTLGDMEKDLTTLCDKVDAIAVAGMEADARDKVDAIAASQSL
jgi:hypothetical protein